MAGAEERVLCWRPSPWRPACTPTSAAPSAPRRRSTPVDASTLVAPSAAGNLTNRGMHLPGISEILVVADGKDAGFETAYDRADRYAGVTGLGTNWEEILAAFNAGSGLQLVANGYQVGVAAGWSFDAARVNAEGCQQAPLRGNSGDGNGHIVNAPETPSWSGGIGLLDHHWGQETWMAGALGDNYADDLRCGADRRLFTAFWKGLYLR